jgi:DnaJ-class molecular chaperone
MDPYKVLGVSTTATQDEIRNAYRKLAKKLHPDLNPGNKDAEKKFKEINGANDILGDPEKRAKYDQGELDESGSPSAGPRGGPFYHETQRGGGARYRSAFGAEHGMDDDFLSHLFEQMGRQHENFDIRGQDVLYQMEVDFKDAALGAEREITLPNGKKLLVKIPAGVETGTKLRMAGQGEPGHGKAHAGDAYIQLQVRPSETFKREGSNVEIELPISLSEAILGAEVKVPTIDGNILLKIPPQSNSGQKLRVPGKGVTILKSSKRGDQIVTLKIVIPPRIDQEFKNAVKSWSERQSFNPRESRGGS